MLLPRNDAWLLRLIQETAAYRSQFRYFLEHPDITALLAADPQLRGILRPLCHALGLRKSQIPSLCPPPEALPNPVGAAPQAAPAAKHYVPINKKFFGSFLQKRTPCLTYPYRFRRLNPACASTAKTVSREVPRPSLSPPLR